MTSLSAYISSVLRHFALVGSLRVPTRFLALRLHLLDRFRMQTRHALKPSIVLTRVPVRAALLSRWK